MTTLEPLRAPEILKALGIQSDKNACKREPILKLFGVTWLWILFLHMYMMKVEHWSCLIGDDFWHPIFIIKRAKVWKHCEEKHKYFHESYCTAFERAHFMIFKNSLWFWDVDPQLPMEKFREWLAQMSPIFGHHQNYRWSIGRTLDDSIYENNHRIKYPKIQILLHTY